jgi:hypothetical protein
MNERTSPVDGKTYAIGFEMRLPKAWNGRFFHQGNGGIDGSVVHGHWQLRRRPADQRAAAGFCRAQLRRRPHARAGGPAFGLDPQARLDYGYQAVGTLTPMAKQLIAAAYGKAPDRSYFGGCSNGGRHTLVARRAMPNTTTAILAGNARLPAAAGGTGQHLRRAALRQRGHGRPVHAGRPGDRLHRRRTQDGGQRRARALRCAGRRGRWPGAGHAPPARRHSASCATCPPAREHATAAA